jgi:hypothetical protein
MAWARWAEGVRFASSALASASSRDCGSRSKPWPRKGNFMLSPVSVAGFHQSRRAAPVSPLKAASTLRAAPSHSQVSQGHPRVKLRCVPIAFVDSGKALRSSDRHAAVRSMKSILI